MNPSAAVPLPAADIVCSRAWPRCSGFRHFMDISRDEQRVLHALAQGGRITLIRNATGKIIDLQTVNRDGWLTNACTMLVFRKLKAKKAIKSSNGQPYRITRRGLELVRSEYDNR